MTQWRRLRLPPPYLTPLKVIGEKMSVPIPARHVNFFVSKIREHIRIVRCQACQVRRLVKEPPILVRHAQALIDVETGLGLEERVALEEVGSYPHPRLHVQDKVGYAQVIMLQHLPGETKPPID